MPTPPFVYQDPLPLGEDTTEYRLLSREGVSVATFEDKEILKVAPEALAYLAQGGVGCISVSANVAPKLCADFQSATREGRWDDALKLQDRLYPLHAALFSDASPGPTKYALTHVRPGYPEEMRLPLTPASDGSKRAVDKALEHAGLI